MQNGSVVASGRAYRSAMTAANARSRPVLLFSISSRPSSNLVANNYSVAFLESLKGPPYPILRRSVKEELALLGSAVCAGRAGIISNMNIGARRGLPDSMIPCNNYKD